MKRVKYISILVIIIFITSFSKVAFAESIVSDGSIAPPEIHADSAVLLDVDSNKILYEKNYKNKMYPASTTKLMTALVTLDKCSDLSEMVKISYYAVHKVPYSYSIANLYPGEEFSVKDLLYALMIPSANDAAYVLAEYIANGGNNYEIDSSNSTKEAFEKSQATFADMMNEKAKELGCENTHFVNPNGIHDDDHYSTAYDLLLMGKQAYANSTIRTIAKTTEYTLDNTSIYTGASRVLKTTNLLLLKSRSGYYEYANGLKTGYTEAAQSCIIASSQKNDRNLIAVVLHSDTTDNSNAPTREDDCKSLFEYGFNNFSNSTLIKKDDVADTITISNATNETKSLNALCQNEVKALTVNGEDTNFTPTIEITKTKAPIAQGEVIGKVTYNVRGENFSSDLIAEHDVIAVDYTPYILAGGIAFIVLIFVIIIIKKIKNRKRRRTYKHNRY